MKVQVTAITPRGTFVSLLVESSKEHVEALQALFEKQDKLDYLVLDTSKGKVYIPSDVLKQSVLTLYIEV